MGNRYIWQYRHCRQESDAVVAFRQTECLEEQGEEKTSLKPQDAKEWADRIKENGYAYKTVTIISVLWALIYIAIEDDYVRKNPFDYPQDNRKPRIALTEE